RKNLQVGIVGGNHPPRLLFMEHFQYGFGNRATKKRISTGTEFVNKHEGFGIGTLRKMLHFREVGTISAEVTLNGLVITNIGKHLPEYTDLRCWIGRDKQARLNHQLQKSDCFHAYRFTA